MKTEPTPPPEVLGSPSGSPSSETPETAAMKKSWNQRTLHPIARTVEAVRLAEKLERERDAARADRDAWKQSCVQYHRANESLDKDRSALMGAIRKMLPDHPILPENVRVQPQTGAAVNSNEAEDVES